MKVKAMLICPRCGSDSGFSFMMEDVKAKVLKAHCSYCSRDAFKIETSSIIEIDKDGNEVSDESQS